MKKIGFVLIILMTSLVYFKISYGTGKLYPSIKTNPILDNSELITLVELEFPPGNVTVSRNGRIFFNFHPFAKADRFSKHRLFEIVNKKPIPFEVKNEIQGVFGLKVDSKDRLWTIEPAGLDYEQTILRSYDINSNDKVFEFKFPKKIATFAQDLRISKDCKYVIIADTGFFKFTNPGLIIFDIEKNSYRIVLSENFSTKPQDWIIKGPLGEHHLGFGLVGFFVGVDGIEISPDENWLYYASMTHDSLYRVPFKKLIDPNTSEKEIVNSIEYLGKKPISDGILMKDNENVILTDIENGGLGIFNLKAKKYQTLISHKKIIWADGVDHFENKFIFTDSAIPSYVDQLAMPPNENVLKSRRPYRIYSIEY
jgi:hypothetical protein